MSGRLRVVVAGATGYAGGELVRILAAHPHAEISAFVSSSSAGEDVAAAQPLWRGMTPQRFQPYERLAEIDADVVFFAAPHGVAMTHAPALLDAGRVVIDIGSDFRLKDAGEFGKWYGEHTAPDLLQRAVYALPEFAREEVRQANLIACPGCYATTLELALLPFVAGGHIRGDIIADAKSGTSGAGKQSGRAELLLAEMAHNYKPYALTGHRHLPEIRQILNAAVPAETDSADAADAVPPLHFVPHLLPTPRGIFASIYFNMDEPRRAADILADYWRGEPFVETLAPPAAAEMAQTLHGNRAILSAHPLSNSRVMLCAAIDNLQKGAAGQAVQNMNIRFGFDERAGLAGAIPPFPAASATAAA